jgi:hypothetical protein
MNQLPVTSYQLPVIPRRLSVCLLLLTVFCFPIFAQSQDDEMPKDAAPPPLKVISKEDRKLLDAENNPKKRAQLSLDLLDLRLKAAEQFVAENKFQNTLTELGTFQALLDDVLKYLVSKDDGGGKADGNFKRLEIGLRKFTPRLELIRRELPYKYAYYVERIQKHLREARAKAIEPLFSDSVVPERKP